MFVSRELCVGGAGCLRAEEVVEVSSVTIS